MQLIVITSSEKIDNEADKINALFEEGMEMLHLRKPDFSLKEYVKLLEEIKKDFHRKIKIHAFFELTENYNLSGVHLNKRNPHYAGNRNVKISKSCHLMDELDTIAEYDYVFLSPIFDSISKKGYLSHFSDAALSMASVNGKINQKVVALGGINPETLPKLKKYAFGGVAVLGSIWETEEVVSNFLKLKSLL